MEILKQFSLYFLLLATILCGCRKEGCTDSDATNYDPDATKNDGSCNYIYGCIDPTAINYNPSATRSNESCEYEGYAMFWTDCNVCAAINVYVDGQYQGQVTGWYTSQPSAPNCEVLYCLSVTLGPGNYSYSGKETSSGITVSGAFTISANNCTIIGL